MGLLIALAIAGGAALVVPRLRRAPATQSPTRVASAPVAVLVEAGTRTVARIPRSAVTVEGRINPSRVAAAIRFYLPARSIVTAGGVRTDYAIERSWVAKVVALPVDETAVVRLEPIAATISTPVVAQKLHNDCEAAALQTLLATDGIKADQLTLQSQLPRSGPLDPERSASDQVWGDPSQGFVGRADGSGPAGGFGVYQGPVAKLAKRYGVRLHDLTGDPPKTVYGRLLEGHAVMVWLGLAGGPYGRWHSPSGQPITVNFNEHTMVLNAIHRDGTLAAVDPLTGTRERWTIAQFETMWARLGRRALST